MDHDKPMTPWYRKPVWLGLLGLTLLVGGYHISTFVPRSPRERSQAEALADLRTKADDELRERLDAYALNVSREPPLRRMGQLVFVAGMGLCVAAGVMAVRQPESEGGSADKHSEATGHRLR